MRRNGGFIKDPLYGYIRISEFEKDVIDTVPVQRLRRIRQLSGAEYVYPAANHSRFEHSLGVMHLAGLMCENVPLDLDENDIQALKIAALLHDLGHGPFSHIFDPILIKYLKKTHEDMTIWLIKESEVRDILQKQVDIAKVSNLAVGRLKEKARPFMDQVISSAVDVDKMDFVARDSYHTGAEYGYTDIFRLIYTMDVHENNLTVNSSALATLEAFLLARLESFKTIYFHRASRAAQIMLVKALENAREELDLTTFPTIEDFLALDDYNVWHRLKKCRRSESIIQDLERRNLLKCAYEITLYTKDAVVTSIFTNETVRKHLEEEISSSASVDVEDIHIDVPSLPSVPYSHSSSEPMDIPISFDSDGKKEIRKVGELSRVIDVLRVYMNILRVYTKKENRQKVKKASEKVLGHLPSETRISY
ncbi:HD domain-containing protein [[Eubacterium] cellulosolvens]